MPKNRCRKTGMPNAYQNPLIGDEPPKWLRCLGVGKKNEMQKCRKTGMPNVYQNPLIDDEPLKWLRCLGVGKKNEMQKCRKTGMPNAYQKPLIGDEPPKCPLSRNIDRYHLPDWPLQRWSSNLFIKTKITIVTTDMLFNWYTTFRSFRIEGVLELREINAVFN